MAEKRQSLKSTASLIFWLLITIIPIIGIVFSILNPIAFYSQQAEYQEFAARWGIFGPLLFIGLQILQVVLAPLSHYAVGFMGGYLYGTFWGALYNWIGRIIGHVVAFIIARKLGRRIADRYVSPDTLNRYDRLVSGRYLVLFFIYFLPLFPDDEISYLVGLSKMRFRWFLLANLLGHVGGALSLAYLGSGVDTKDPLFWTLTIVTLAGFPLLWFASKWKRRPATD